MVLRNQLNLLLLEIKKDNDLLLLFLLSLLFLYFIYGLDDKGRSVARPRSEILFKPDRRVKIDEVQKTSYAKNYCKNYNNFYSYAKPMVF